MIKYIHFKKIIVNVFSGYVWNNTINNYHVSHIHAPPPMVFYLQLDARWYFSSLYVFWGFFYQQYHGSPYS